MNKPRRAVALGVLLASAPLAVAASCGGDPVVEGVGPVADAAADGSATCRDDGPPLAGDCDPIGGYCGFPFPSNVYLADDTSGKNPSGKALRFGPGTLPVNSSTGAPVDPALFEGLDGFSPASAPMVYLPGATATGLATPLDVATTLDPASPTIILDAETGELVPHFVDVDQQAPADDQRALMLHPARLLRNGARYVVAIRRVRDSSGEVIAPTEAFSALRDGTASPDASVAGRRCLYADIFRLLDAAGVRKDELQVAWDFTVGSRESITGPLVKVRDAALAVVGDDGPTFVIKTDDQGKELITEAPNPYILRRLVLTMTVPRYLTTDVYATGDPVPHLLFDDGGAPKQNGTMDVDVLVQVPNSVQTAGKHGLLQNGHGLFGSKEEGQNGYAAMIADGYHWIVLATDLFGFAEPDLFMAGEGLTGRPEVLGGFMDRQIQGHVNQLLAMRMMKGRVARDGVRDAGGNLVLDPAWIDASLRAYRGDSQGGIMGGTYMAVSTDVTRGLLGEPGTPYSVLLNRSKDSSLYNGLLSTTYGDGRAVQILWSLIQLYWDRSEPSGFVPFLAKDTLPGTPEHRVLMHDALGDHQVTTFGAHIMARAIGARLLESNDPARPVLRDVFGLVRAKGPLSGESALVEYDFGLPAEPTGNVPPLAGCDPHDRVRYLEPSFQQQDEFFRTGTITWKCDGTCNCDGDAEEGGCADSYLRECCSGPEAATDPRCSTTP